MALDGTPEEHRCSRCAFLYKELVTTEKFREYGIKQALGWRNQNFRTMAILYVSALTLGNSLSPLPFWLSTIVFVPLMIWWFLGMRERDRFHRDSMERIEREVREL